MKRIAVIGGGVSGLASAYYLEKGADAEITLFEQSGRLGGVIRSERENGFCWEMGPDSFLSQKPAGIRLAEELGLTERLVNSNSRSVFVVRGGRLVPFPAGFQFFVPSRWGALARTPLLGWKAKFQVLQELFRRRGPQREEISVAGFVRNRLGDEIYEYLAEPLLSGIYGGDAEQLSMNAVLPQLLAYEGSHGNVIRGVLHAARASPAAAGAAGPWSLFVSFRDGMQEFTDRLAARLARTQVRREQPVEEVARDGPRFRVQGEAFDAVVLATSAAVAGRLLGKADPEIAGLLLQIPYTSAITVSLGYRSADLPEAEGGFGYVAPRVENRPVLACSWLSAKFAGRAPEGHTYVRGFLGGARFPQMIDFSDQQLTALVVEELGALMGVARPPEMVKVARWSAAMAQPVVGHPQRIASLRERLAAHPGLALAGNYLDGIGIPDCIRSAQSAAEKISPSGQLQRQ